jgi:uncharacterized integral membrane protein
MQVIESGDNLEVYQGQFGTFTIADRDRQGVIVYRSALLVAAISFAIGTLAVLLPATIIDRALVLNVVTVLFAIFSVALGVALATIHIYLVVLHRALQLFLAIGSIAAIYLSFVYHQPIGEIVYEHPLSILGVGFSFAALTGIFFKEAFCFDRFETKFLTFIVPGLLLGHMFGILPHAVEVILLSLWAGLFMVFALRKFPQAIPADIGDKSVFDELAKRR